MQGVRVYASKNTPPLFVEGLGVYERQIGAMISFLSIFIFTGAFTLTQEVKKCRTVLERLLPSTPASHALAQLPVVLVS